MQSIKLVGAAVAVSLFAIPMAASAGGSYVHKTCNGTTCHPGKPVEKVVPKYYPVPTKTQHIYYDVPAAQPVTTQIIHHVPTPVYGQTHINEVVNGGQWTGPALGCCGQVQTSYCYKGSSARYNNRGHRVGCR